MLSLLWLRRLGSERAAALGLAALVFVTALAAAAGPLAFARLADEALGRELAASASFERNTVVYEIARPRARPLLEPAAVTAASERIEAGFPSAVGRLVGQRGWLVETSLWQVRAGTAVDSVMRLRVHEGALERLRLVEGRMPTGRVTVMPDDRPNAPPNSRAWVYEAVAPAVALERMGARVGDRLPLTVFLADPLNLGQNVGAHVVVVGSYELSDPADPFWINDVTIAGWRFYIVPPDAAFVETTALLAPDAYRALVANTQGVGLTLLYQWRYFLEPRLLDADGLAATIADLRRLEASTPRSGISDVPSDTTLSSGLLRLLLDHRARWASAQVVLAVAALGLAAIAVATLAVVALAGSAGRRSVAGLLTARGASRRQLARNTLVEAALLGLPPALLGGALALVAVGRSDAAPALAAALTVWLATGAILLVLVMRAGRAPAADGGGGPRRVGRPTPRRLVVETSLVMAALAGAWVLRERGLGGPIGTDGLAIADPLVAAVPALVGLAAGVVALRLYGLPGRLLGALLARRRDLLPVLATRRLVRSGSAAPVVLLMIATATIGTFAAATLTHLEEAAEVGAWQRLGAAYRISSPSLSLPASLDEATLPGVEAAARGSLRSVGTDRGTTWLLSLDAPAYLRVVADAPADGALPAQLLDDAATESVPLIASGGLGVRRGDQLTLSLGRSVTGRIVDVRSGFAGVPAGEEFVVASSRQLGEALGGRSPAPTFALLRADPGAASALRDALEASAPGMLLESQAEASEATRGAPVMAALRSLLTAAVVVAVGYAALAVAAAMALAAAGQRLQLAHLRAVGVSRSGGRWLSLLEYGPATLLGYLGGAALGLALFAFVRPGLGLTAVSGPVPDFAPGIEPLGLAGLLAASVVILIVGWFAAAIVQRDSDPAALMRRGAE